MAEVHARHRTAAERAMGSRPETWDDGGWSQRVSAYAQGLADRDDEIADWLDELSAAAGPRLSSWRLAAAVRNGAWEAK